MNEEEKKKREREKVYLFRARYGTLGGIQPFPISAYIRSTKIFDDGTVVEHPPEKTEDE